MASIRDDILKAMPDTERTKLDDEGEANFQTWVHRLNQKTEANPELGFKVFDPTQAYPDYDMRGYYKAMMAGDPNAQQSDNGHFPDTWKTSRHNSFSTDSMYATPTAPHWVEHPDRWELTNPDGTIRSVEQKKTPP